MAVYCIATPQITINTVDLSEYLKDVSLTYEADELETTASGDTSKEFIAGLKSWKVDATVNQDYTASKVDATLFPLVGAAPFAVVLRPTSAIKGANNPEFTGNCILTSYPPMSGAVGEVATVKFTMRGTGALARGV